MKAVLINIFGGIVRCDMIAEGVIGAVEEVGVKVPVVVRLQGNNAELGAEVLEKSGLNIIQFFLLSRDKKKEDASKKLDQRRNLGSFLETSQSCEINLDPIVSLYQLTWLKIELLLFTLE